LWAMDCNLRSTNIGNLQLWALVRGCLLLDGCRKRWKRKGSSYGQCCTFQHRSTSVLRHYRLTVLRGRNSRAFLLSGRSLQHFCRLALTCLAGVHIDDMRLEIFLQPVLAVSAADSGLAPAGVETLHGLKVFAVNVSLAEFELV
jgi:hypothetical protein